MAVRPARTFTSNPDARNVCLPTLLFEPNCTHNCVQLPGRADYSSNVLNLRVSHEFSPDFYLKGFIQYNDDRKTASFNFLWPYHYQSGSDLYVWSTTRGGISTCRLARVRCRRSHRAFTADRRR